MVLAAGSHADPESTSALERLCRIYWLPLYAYVRRRGYSPEDAQDLTQEFFAGLLARNGLERVSPLKGRFRSFLLASVNHLLSDQRDRACRVKRGGGKTALSLDAEMAEERRRLDGADHWTPEHVFDRRWAQALVEAVLAQLQQECDRADKARHFAVLKHFLTGEDLPNYQTAADQLGMPKAQRAWLCIG